MILSVSFLFGACASTNKSVEPEQKQAKAEVTKPVVKAEVSTSQIIKCSLEKDQRSLELKSKEKGCELNYTKTDLTQIVASSSIGPNHCEKTQSKIKGNLEEAGFKCN